MPDRIEIFSKKDGKNLPNSPQNPIYIKIAGGGLSNSDGQSVDIDELKREIKQENDNSTDTKIASEVPKEVTKQIEALKSTLPSGGTGGGISEEQVENKIQEKIGELHLEDFAEKDYIKRMEKTLGLAVGPDRSDDEKRIWEITSDQGTASVLTIGYFSPNNTDYAGKQIVQVQLNVKTAGTFTVMKIENYGTATIDELRVVEEYTITATQTGLQTFDVNFNGEFKANQRFAIMKQGDTGVFHYNPTNKGTAPGGFVMYTYSSKAKGTTSSYLNVGITVKPKETSTSVDATYSTNLHPFAYKNLAIVGDSISTFQGEIVAGNAHFYPRADITKNEDTWVYKLNQKLRTTMYSNTYRDAWSGSRVSNTGSGSLQTRKEKIPTDAELILIFMGTNDAGNNIPLGTINKTFTGYNVNEFTGGYQAYLDALITRVPRAKIVLMTPMKRFDSGKASDFVDAFADRVLELGKLYGLQTIDMRELGITKFNQTAYFQDGLHPNKAGMDLMVEFIKSKLV